MALSQKRDWKCWPPFIASLKSWRNSSKKEGFLTWVVDAEVAVIPILIVASNVEAVQEGPSELVSNYFSLNCSVKIPFLGKFLGIFICFIDFSVVVWI